MNVTRLASEYVVEAEITTDFMREVGKLEDEAMGDEAEQADRIAAFLEANPEIEAVIWTQPYYGIQFGVVRGPMTPTEAEAIEAMKR